MGLTVMTAGAFDPLHGAHVELFNTCRKLAGLDGRVIVGVNSDEFYAAYRHRPPMMPETDRMGVIRALTTVDEVFLNPGGIEQPMLMLDHRIDVWVNGMDWAHDGHLQQLSVPSWDWFTDHGITMTYVPRHGSQSGTEIRGRA